MKKVAGWSCATAFPILCAAALVFLEGPGRQGPAAHAALYSLPAGASALAFALLLALFLLSPATGKRDWPLLLPTLAAATLTLHRICAGYDQRFLPDGIQAVFSGWWASVLAAAALALYLSLHRQPLFWQMLGRIAALSAWALWSALLLSWLWEGPLLYEALLLFQSRNYASLLYWFTLWLTLACTLLAVWSLSFSAAHSRAQAKSLSLQNQLVLENYRALEGKLHAGAALRHEASHRLVAIEALLQAEDLDGLRRCLSTWKAEHARATPASFTKNLAVNLILQDAASRAGTVGIPFRASAPIPEYLPIPEEDLCTLLMNLLDNALEGAGRTPEGAQRFLSIKMKVSGALLTVWCENSFDGRVAEDPRGRIQTIKPDPASHGLGLAQVRGIVEKYGGTLELHHTASIFTVRTLLNLRKKP